MQEIRFFNTCLANKGKDSCGEDMSLPSSVVTYWIMNAQFFALVDVNLKLKFCTKPSFPLL